MQHQHSEDRGVLYAMMVVLGFLAVLGLAIGGLYLYHRTPDFYSALQGRIHRSFYLSAAALLIFSSVLYTPFSYGISRYFILSARGEARFSALFYLFTRPVLLTKATLLSIYKKAFIHLERLLALMMGAMLEVGLFLSFLLFTGEDLFAVKENPFLLAADFMLRSPWLIALSVILWIGVLFLMLLSYLRYILCKYVLLCVPDAGPWQALRVGRLSLQGRLWHTLFFYLGYGARCVLSILPFGGRRKPRKSFSVYACELVEQGWQSYCQRRSRRAV